MSLEHPTALAAAAVPAALLALALLRPRRRDFAVGSLLIWRRAVHRAGAVRPPADTLPAAVALGLLGAALLVLAWAGPALTGSAGRRDVRILLDRSAGMASLRTDGTTRFDEARRRCAAFLGSLSADDRAELILVPDDDLPAKPSGPPARLAGFLAGLTPAATDADWTAVLRAQSGAPRPTVVFTSRPFEGDPAAAPHVDLVGGRTDNLAVAGPADLELPDGRRQICVEVRNTGRTAVSADVRLSADAVGLPLPERAEPGVNGPARVTVAPGGTARVYWTGVLPAGAKFVEARLVVADALAADDVRRLALRPAARLRVHVTAGGGDAAFFDKLLAAHPRVERAGSPAEADLVIAAGAELPPGWNGPLVSVGRPQPADLATRPIVANRALQRFTPDSASVFRHADLAGLPVASLVPLSPNAALGQRAAAWTEQGEVAAVEWEAAGAGGRARRVALGFSCAAANVVWTDGLVVFWGRLLDSFLPAPADPPPPARPLADEDRPLPADIPASLPADGAAAPWSLRPLLAAAAALLFAAGWWLAGRSEN